MAAANSGSVGRGKELNVPDELIEAWREALIRKSATRLLEMLDNPVMTAMTWDEAEAFVRCTLGAYDDILLDKKK